MLQNTVKIAKDPGVLFSLLHASTFLVTSGASSPAFAIAMGSLGLSVGFSAVQKKVIPNNLTIPNGAALTTNGIILSSITALSIASSNVPTAIISGLYAISNTSKGLEMGGKKNLKTLGNYLLPKNDLVSRTIKNTAFSAEFIASLLSGMLLWPAMSWAAFLLAMALPVSYRTNLVLVMKFWR